MISPVVALAYFAWRLWAGVQAIAGRHSSPAQIELLPGRFVDDPRFARACDELRALQFSELGDFEVRTQMGAHSRQRTFLRAFLSPDRSAYAVVYELTNVTQMPGARSGGQKIWAELVSRRGEDQSLTTSNGEPALSLLDPNPDRPVQRFPDAPLVRLLEEHRRAAGASLSELSPEGFAPLFTQAWTRAFEFHQSRGLYLRQGNRFVATARLGLRSALEFHLMLRHRTGPRYVLSVMAAVACGAALTAVADGFPQRLAAPIASGLVGAGFGALFRKFELPGVLMVCGLALALRRDDPLAIAAFLFALLNVAIALQRARARKAAARIAS